MSGTPFDYIGSSRPSGPADVGPGSATGMDYIGSSLGQTQGSSATGSGDY